MDDSQKAHWEQIKARGFWHFVSVYGVLIMGGNMIIGLTLYDYFLSRSGFSLEKVLINSVCALIAAAAAAALLWFVNERRYRKNQSGDSFGGK